MQGDALEELERAVAAALNEMPIDDVRQLVGALEQEAETGNHKPISRASVVAHVTPDLCTVMERSVRIALDFLEGSGQVKDPIRASRFLASTVQAMIERGEVRQLVLTNRAIAAYSVKKRD